MPLLWGVVWNLFFVFSSPHLAVPTYTRAIPTQGYNGALSPPLGPAVLLVVMHGASEASRGLCTNPPDLSRNISETIKKVLLGGPRIWITSHFSVTCGRFLHLS